jgi:hypothetical protein
MSTIVWMLFGRSRRIWYSSWKTALAHYALANSM